jgi:3-methyladenine DNA glycosylase AlkD
MVASHRRKPEVGSENPHTASTALAELVALGNPEAAAFVAGYFKTGKGEYGEGDQFLGVRVPVLRKLARAQWPMELSEILKLLRSKLHEARLLALLLVGRAYERGSAKERQEIYRAYLDHTKHINNWDLVDVSAPAIVGRHLFAGNRAVLARLARSRSLWERRIAIISTQYFIRQGDFADTLRIAGLLLQDREDLIHKAVGWMLREVGNRDVAVLRRFLREHYRTMPRTMLRYAIEKFPPAERSAYLAGTIHESARA